MGNRRQKLAFELSHFGKLTIQLLDLPRLLFNGLRLLLQHLVTQMQAAFHKLDLLLGLVNPHHTSQNMG